MDRETVPRAVECDLRKLPLDAREAFLLSQVDGHSTVQEIAEIIGLDLATAVALTSRLRELGAIIAAEPKAARTTKAPTAPPASRPPRIDPRAETKSVPPAPFDARAEDSSVQPSPPRTTVERAPAKRASRKSIAAVRVGDDACELDEATLTYLFALDAKLGTADHYALLGIERDADKKTIKRAYFAFAGRCHPDRFFGKKLGKARIPLDRAFARMTEAHDVLTDIVRRADYDERFGSPMTPSGAPPKKPSRTMAAAPFVKEAPKRSSKKMSAVPDACGPARRRSSRKMAAAAPAPQPVEQIIPSEKSIRQLYGGVRAAQQLGAQRRIELFVKAAEDALMVDDVITAANNYRLALEHGGDSDIKRKLDEVDDRARMRRREGHLARARGAEREKHWAEAAEAYVRAHDACPAAALAERAAHALLMAESDLEKATQLATHAVDADEKNADYCVTLGEVHVASKRFDDAIQFFERAIELSPTHSRAIERAAALKNRMKKER